MILANRLVLSLHLCSQSEESSEPISHIDIFFRDAYGQSSQSRNPINGQSYLGSILGNIGEPLYIKVREDDQEDPVPDAENVELISLSEATEDGGEDMSFMDYKEMVAGHLPALRRN